MNPLAILGWILIGGVGLILAAIFAAIAILIIRASLRVNVSPKDEKETR
ncbi:hypothetical protein [Leifsonia sp. NPDC058248]